MIVQTHYVLPHELERVELATELDSSRTLVLVFSSLGVADMARPAAVIREAFGRSTLLGCSTAGEVVGPLVRDGGVSVAIARFGRTDLTSARAECPQAARSFQAGKELAARLDAPTLSGVLVLSDGLTVNGTDLLEGLSSGLADDVTVVGGLAGDRADFRQTWVLPGNAPEPGTVAAVGLHGPALVMGHGSEGGWDDFGPERTVTAAEGNVVLELDGRNALDLYEEYLGDLAAGLPASGLYFPLQIRPPEGGDALVRTLLAVDRGSRTLTFAGNVPRGWSARFMRANLDRLIDGAKSAAEEGRRFQDLVPAETQQLGLAVSCVGRRLVLKERTDEELEAVLDTLAPGTELVGFYSYGEISPLGDGPGELHNQTMTVTTLSERA